MDKNDDLRPQRVNSGRPRAVIPTTLVALIVAAGACPAARAAAQDDADGLPAGLVATFVNNGAAKLSVFRVDATPNFWLRANESPHPRIDSRAWAGRWEGQIQILRSAKYRFSADLVGELTVSIDGRSVLRGTDKSDQAEPLAGQEIELDAGDHRIVIEFSKPDGPARLRLLWESPHFRREPVPWRLLRHRPADETPALRRSQLDDRGRFLVEEFGCVACHRPSENDKLAQGLAARQGPDLSRVGERAFAGWMFKWLEDPQAIRPQAVMPRMFTNDDAGRVERIAVARFLASLGGPVQTPRNSPKPDERMNFVRRGERLFARVGCAVCHSATGGGRAFAGLGPLGSKTMPDRLAQYLQNPLAVDPSGRMPHMMLDGSEARDLAYFLCATTDGDPDHAPPEPPAAESVTAAFRRIEASEKEIELFEKLSAGGRLIALGKRLVVAKRCSNCHKIEPGGQALPALQPSSAFAALRNRVNNERGCLQTVERDHDGDATVPRFALSAEDRECLTTFLATGSSGSGPLSPTYAAQVALRRFNCVGCHASGGAGGLSPTLVDVLRKYENAQDAEAIQPPPLTEVGAKLRTPWLRDVLVGGRRARPWMGLRMPQFGAANVGNLPEHFAAADGVAPNDEIKQFDYDAEHVEAGRFLVGKKAFGCISCHDIAGRPNTGTRGPDLATMNERVRYDWYSRWLDDPQRMQPGTRMPTVFPNGTTALKSRLDGSGAAQSDAIWEYLSLGANLPLPEGLEPPRGLTLEARDRPLLVRTFMPDAGTHALAVGFPGGISFAFDATRCRLAYGWTGGFLNAAPIWNDRGGNPAGVLGPRFWTAPVGFPWSFSDSPGDLPPNWSQQQSNPAFGAPLAEGKLAESPARLHFLDYNIGKDGRPSVRYTFDLAGEASDPSTVEIRERFEPRQELAGVGVVRRFELRPRKTVVAWLLMAQSGPSPRFLTTDGNEIMWDRDSTLIEQPTEGRHLALAQGNAGVQLVRVVSAPAGTKWSSRKDGNEWQTMLRFTPVAAGQPNTVVLCIWSPYRNDESMIRALLGSKVEQ